MDIDLDAASKMLYAMEPLRRPVMQAIISSLSFPKGSRGLDAGCGTGLQTALLARATGPGGHVTGLDISTPFVETAQVMARQAALGERLSYQQGSWNQIPYERGAFDWVWSMDAAGYGPHESLSTVQELARVIKPGGSLILGYWSSQCLLPGYPALEARLNASPAGLAPFVAGASPDTHYLYTRRRMQQAGLVDTRAETFVQTLSAPLAPELREALTQLFEMRWGMAESDVSPDDWQAYLRLCREASPEMILDSPGYYGFFTYSVFYGTVPER